MSKSVFYDANFSIGDHRGMGKYINFIHEVLITSGFKVIPLLAGSKTKKGYSAFGFSNYILWEQFSLPKFQKVNKGIYIFPYNTAPLLNIRKGNSNILVIHDLIFMDNLGETMSIRQKIGKAYRKFVLPKVIHKFEYIITVSEYSKSKIAKRFNIPLDRIEVIPNSTDFPGNLSSSVRENYIFHLGGEPDYKNTKTLIRAYSMLPIATQQKYKLRILGIRNKNVISSYFKLFDDLGIKGRVELLGYQTDEEVKELYSKASLFVFTSLEEGFGIPLIEAMSSKTPLVSSSASCLPEVAGDAALYFDPYSDKDLAQKIVYALQNSKEMAYKVMLGQEQVLKFSPEIVKGKVLNYFNQVYESFNSIS